MATTAKGTPYVVSTDLVANYPTVSSDLATHIDAKLAYNAVTINAQTGTTYTFALADASEGKLVTASNAGSQTYTVPPQSSVTWAAGAVLRILNQGAGTVTIAGGSGVTINGTPLTLAQYKGAAIQRTAADIWTFIPFTGGVGNANFSDAATGTYSSGGTNYKYITYLASGTLTVTTAGFADVLCVGGGGAGGGNGTGGGGGAGGYLSITNAYLAAGTLTVTVGGGGSPITGGDANNDAGGIGNASAIGPYVGIGGGGGGGGVSGVGGSGNGGSGGGAGGDGASIGSAMLTSQGNNGGNSTRVAGNRAGGGGGGATAAGANSPGNLQGGNGGAGTASSITGASVTRAGGGGGGIQNAGTIGTGGTGGGGNGSQTGVGVAGTINTGGGGGGSGGGAGADGGNGGSGIVIIRVAV